MSDFSLRYIPEPVVSSNLLEAGNPAIAVNSRVANDMNYNDNNNNNNNNSSNNTGTNNSSNSNPLQFPGIPNSRIVTRDIFATGTSSQSINYYPQKNISLSYSQAPQHRHANLLPSLNTVANATHYSNSYNANDFYGNNSHNNIINNNNNNNINHEYSSSSSSTSSTSLLHNNTNNPSGSNYSYSTTESMYLYAANQLDNSESTRHKEITSSNSSSPYQLSPNQMIPGSVTSHDHVNGHLYGTYGFTDTIGDGKIKITKATVNAAIAAAEASAAVDSGVGTRRRRRKAPVSSADLATTTKRYPCEMCDKVFHRPYNLRSHLKSHSDEKPFACKHCGRKFTRGHDKKRHELLHDGNKKFKCGGLLKDGVTRWGCNKKFARADALGRHFRTETGWLCIRPLMKEAKENEEMAVSMQMNYANTYNSSNQAQVNSVAQQAAQAQLNSFRSFAKPGVAYGLDNSNPDLAVRFSGTRGLYSNINLNNYDDPTSTNEAVINDILKNAK